MLAKKKIGFIDLFIDEWHANNYPKWFREAKRSNEFELGYAWEESTMEGRRNLQQWCAEMGMTPACSMEEAGEKSDCICVLAPANPEVHERLAAFALKSGKPVYIDKPFAESLATAERIFETAEKYNTPLMSVYIAGHIFGCGLGSDEHKSKQIHSHGGHFLNYSKTCRHVCEQVVKKSKKQRFLRKK